MSSALPIDMEVRGLVVKKGGATLLSIPELDVRAGEVLALLGPNGAGKTTLIQTLSLLLRPSEGRIRFKDEEVKPGGNHTAMRRRMAVIFQTPLLFDTTVRNNVAAGLRLRGVSRTEIRQRVAEMLETFGISHLIGRSCRTLSGGEASRVSLARAFVLRPEILFLDEPFGSLDPPTRQSLIADLESLLRRSSTTAVLSTHDPSEAIRMADRIAVIREGRILQVGGVDEVMNRPVDEFIAQFMGTEAVLDARVVEALEGSFIAKTGEAKIEVAGSAEPGERVILCIRPENVTLATIPGGGQAVSARNVLDGEIRKITPMGFYFMVRLDCGFPLVACVTKHSVEGLELAPGKQVTASFKATAIHAIRKGR